MAYHIDTLSDILSKADVVGIDALGFDRSHASKHYTKRTECQETIYVYLVNSIIE